jgi:hypothetical protein
MLSCNTSPGWTLRSASTTAPTPPESPPPDAPRTTTCSDVTPGATVYDVADPVYENTCTAAAEPGEALNGIAAAARNVLTAQTETRRASRGFIGTEYCPIQPQDRSHHAARSCPPLGVPENFIPGTRLPVPRIVFVVRRADHESHWKRPGPAIRMVSMLVVPLPASSGILSDVFETLRL